MKIRLIVGGSDEPRIFEIHGEIPQDDQLLLARLERAGGVASAARDYGPFAYKISLDKAPPLQVSVFLEGVKSCFAAHGCKLEQIR